MCWFSALIWSRNEEKERRKERRSGGKMMVVRERKGRGGREPLKCEAEEMFFKVS